MTNNKHKDVTINGNNNILMIAYYFPPLASGGTLRTLKYVKYLPVYHWRPHILTVNNAHHLTFDRNLENQIPPEAVIYRTKAILPARFFRKKLNDKIDHQNNQNKYKPKFLKRIFIRIKEIIYTFFFCPDEFIGWLPFAFSKGLKVISENDLSIIYSTSPPNSTHLIALLLKKITGRPWIADFRDLWDQYPESYNPMGFTWKQKLDNYFECLVLKNADRAVVISATMKNQLNHKYPRIDLTKIKVIYNGFDPEDFDQNEPEIRDDQNCIILHAGTLSSWRRTPNLFAAFSELINENAAFAKNVRLQLMGLIFAEVRNEIDCFRLNTHIHIIPHQSYQATIRKMKSVDYLLLIVGDLPKAQNALALKLFDYIGAKKPILAIAPSGETAELIRNYKLGFVAHPNKKKEIRNMLEVAYKMWDSKNCDFEPSFQSMQKRFDRKVLTKQLFNLLEELNA